jgi:hypothetical protein
MGLHAPTLKPVPALRVSFHIVNLARLPAGLAFIPIGPIRHAVERHTVDEWGRRIATYLDIRIAALASFDHVTFFLSISSF